MCLYQPACPSGNHPKEFRLVVPCSNTQVSNLCTELIFQKRERNTEESYVVCNECIGMRLQDINVHEGLSGLTWGGNDVSNFQAWLHENRLIRQEDGNAVMELNWSREFKPVRDVRTGRGELVIWVLGVESESARRISERWLGDESGQEGAQEPCVDEDAEFRGSIHSEDGREYYDEEPGYVDGRDYGYTTEHDHDGRPSEDEEDKDPRMEISGEEGEEDKPTPMWRVNEEFHQGEMLEKRRSQGLPLDGDEDEIELVTSGFIVALDDDMDL